MVDLTLDRIHKATVECQKIIAEKSRLLSEEIEAKAAKKFREAAAAGTCLICMDENPNIATLCCGKAVHINCMATWLSNRLECPHCRAELPSLPQRQPAPPARVVLFSSSEGSPSTFDDGEEHNTADDTTSSIYEEDPVMHGDADGTTAAVEDDTEEMQDTTDDVPEGTETSEEMVTDTGTAEEDTEETEDSDDSTVVISQPRPVPQMCLYTACRNRSANGCQNGACGRCCLMYGRFACERHNV